jgi:hypothetical protein
MAVTGPPRRQVVIWVVGLWRTMPEDATRWALVNAKKKAEALEAENARLRERIRELEGKLLDLGGDPTE